MALSAERQFDISSSILCGLLILTRCAYRLIVRCKIHANCHRQWRVDDSFMAFALVPLVCRSIFIFSSFGLDPTQSMTPPTETEALAAGLTVEELTANRVLARKFIIPGRIFYALFLWTLKLCLLSFYSRILDAFEWGSTAVRMLRYIIIATLFAVLIATLTECRPLSLNWHLVPPAGRDHCTKGLANLLVMAVFNILTDLALIILPFPIFKFTRLDPKAKVQLSLLFGIGSVVILITILRIPLILLSSVSQRSRSMWASIEILCACIVANTAFFVAIVKDLQGQHVRDPNKPSATTIRRNLRLQNMPSSLRGFDVLERPPTALSNQASSLNSSRKTDYGPSGVHTPRTNPV